MIIDRYAMVQRASTAVIHTLAACSCNSPHARTNTTSPRERAERRQEGRREGLIINPCAIRSNIQLTHTSVSMHVRPSNPLLLTRHVLATSKRIQSRKVLRKMLQPAPRPTRSLQWPLPTRAKTVANRRRARNQQVRT